MTPETTRHATPTDRHPINRVRDYIARHLDERLTVAQLSEVAYLSKYHFHRQFLEATGVNVIRYIRLMRLKRASCQLAFYHHARIIHVALEAGYQNAESFSRAFKKVFGQTPSQFRKQPGWQHWTEQFHFISQLLPQSGEQQMDVNIVQFDETAVASLAHRGSPAEVYDTAARFIEWRKQSGQSPVDRSRTFGIVRDNPNTTPPEQFRFDICGSVDGPVADNPQGVVAAVIPGGRCAVVRHLGSHDHIAPAVVYLCQEWLPASGEELRDFPCFFHYLNLLYQVPEHELVTDIYLPLQ